MLAKALQRQVPAGVRQRGMNYYHNRRVVGVVDNGRSLRAEVEGTEVYHVLLTLEPPHGLAASCSCPFFAGHNSACKHVWAAILEADRRRWPKHAAPRNLYLDEPLDYDDPFGEGRRNGHPPGRQDSTQAPSRRKSRRRKRKSANWKSAIKTLEPVAQGPSTPGLEEGQLVYLVEATDGAADTLRMRLYTRRRKPTGEWARPQPVALQSLLHREDLAPDHRQVLTFLDGCRREGTLEAAGIAAATVFLIAPPQALTVLPWACETSQCWIGVPTEPEGWQPLYWDDRAPWIFHLRAAYEERTKTYLLSGELNRGIERRPLSDVTQAIPGGIAFFRNQAVRFDDRHQFHWVRLFRQEPTLRIPAAQRDKFLADLFRLAEMPPAEVLQVFRIGELNWPMVASFLIMRPRDNPYWGETTPPLEGHLSFRYGDVAAGAQDHRKVLYDPKDNTISRRDFNAEKVARERLADLKVQPGNSDSTYRLPAKQFAKVARTLAAEGWHVEAEGKLYRSPSSVKFEIVSSDIDWFELHGGVSYDGHKVPLPKLLAAIKKGDGTIVLDDGTLGVLPEEWMQKYGLLAQVGKTEGDHLRFSGTQAGMLDALLASQPGVTWDAGFAKFKEKLERFSGIQAADPPESFQGKLRGYQREGLGWFRFLEDFNWGGCLADDMGLGKTVQVLAMLAHRLATRPEAEAKTSLVVMPSTLIFNWHAEATRFVPHLKVLRHHGIDRVKDAAHLLEHDLVLTTYATLRRDVLLFKEMEFDYCILDESQAVKNAGTEQAKAVRLLRGKHRLAMSGTPIENHLGELWSLFEFLNPGMLGSASVFQGAVGKKVEPETQKFLAHALRPFILRRTKDQVAKDLPEKTEQTLFCDLEGEERKQYEELRAYYRESLLGRIEREGLAKSKIQVLEALLRLRQASCHPGLLDPKKADHSSAKLDVLLPQLREVFEENHKALVFSQFTTFLGIVKQHLDEEGIPYEYLDGRTRDRASRVERFQNDPECKLFLISLKAGGVGLNLTAAEYVFLLDPWWNPAVEAQAIDRTHRIGQTKPVFAYRIIARDTVEEKVLDLQKSKRELADAILNADSSVIRNLGKEDLELLLS